MHTYILLMCPRKGETAISCNSVAQEPHSNWMRPGNFDCVPWCARVLLIRAKGREQWLYQRPYLTSRVIKNGLAHYWCFYCLNNMLNINSLHNYKKKTISVHPYRLKMSNEEIREPSGDGWEEGSWLKTVRAGEGYWWIHQEHM